MNKSHIAIIVFDDVDLMDVTGPKEVFSAVKTPRKNHTLNEDPVLDLYNSEMMIQVSYLSVKDRKQITTSDGTSILTKDNLKNINVEDYDAIVIPGGKGVHAIKKDNFIHSILKNAVDNELIILSVCTGVYLLAESDLVGDFPITTHHRHYDLFSEIYPQLDLVRDVRFVEKDNFIITGGVTSGIDGALRLVEKLYSSEIASQAARIINYTID